MKNSAQNKEEKKLIDIDRIISGKNPKLYKKLPEFIIKYIKRTIHQDVLNNFIQKNNLSTGNEFLENSFTTFNVYSKIINENNLPDNSNVIFVANHPIGSFDGLHIINILFKKYGKVKAVVNDILLNVKSLNEFFVGVNKHGITPREQIALLNDIFNSDYPFFFFPSGMVSRKNKGKITDGDWKKTFVTRAIKHKRDVIPIYIEGKLSNKFYRFANIRKFLGIKANLEMFYLVDESIKQKGNTLKITIGKPIAYSKFDKSKSHFEWAQEVKKHIYKIGEDIEPEF
ncbi:MAG: 1-acyl-sn-glycerol-3-phosphate acyltransferase [Bacteroidales bacterium]|nr:1-acyl-sn-glycerol-3-phosphate acyltransferase [Bacteroidales bacterium]